MKKKNIWTTAGLSELTENRLSYWVFLLFFLLFFVFNLHALKKTKIIGSFFYFVVVAAVNCAYRSHFVKISILLKVLK